MDTEAKSSRMSLYISFTDLSYSGTSVVFPLGVGYLYVFLFLLRLCRIIYLEGFLLFCSCYNGRLRIPLK